MIAGKRTSNRRSASSAFTLLEVILAMSVMLIAMGFAWPVLTGAFENRRVRAGADRIAAAWSKARLKAMTAGRIHAWEFHTADDRFRVRPLEAVANETRLDEGGGASADASSPRSVMRLPEGVFFANPLTSTAEDGSALLEAKPDWSAPVLFYPDGTATDVRVVIGNANDRYVTVTLRALTATTTVGPTVSQQELEQENPK